MTQLMRRAAAALLAAAPLLLLASPLQLASAEPRNVEIAYQGELLDEKQQPIAGVYPLEFRIYNDARSENPLWRELHWIALADGRYHVRLGSESPIRANLATPGARLFLGIHLAGGGELLREPVTFPGAAPTDKPDATTAADKTPPPAATPEPPPADAHADSPRYKTESSFAEVADFAKRAGTAENAEKLNGRTLEDLEAEIERLRDELARHRADKAAHGEGAATGAPKLNGASTTLPRVGGTGGTPYTRECPPGHVVTGIRGAAGALIDSVQLICTPLE